MLLKVKPCIQGEYSRFFGEDQRHGDCSTSGSPGELPVSFTWSRCPASPTVSPWGRSAACLLPHRLLHLGEFRRGGGAGPLGEAAPDHRRPRPRPRQPAQRPHNRLNYHAAADGKNGSSRPIFEPSRVHRKPVASIRYRNTDALSLVVHFIAVTRLHVADC